VPNSIRTTGALSTINPASREGQTKRELEPARLGMRNGERSSPRSARVIRAPARYPWRRDNAERQFDQAVGEIQPDTAEGDDEAMIARRRPAIAARCRRHAGDACRKKRGMPASE